MDFKGYGVSVYTLFSWLKIVGQVNDPLGCKMLMSLTSHSALHTRDSEL
jgi:hypothetical protein